MSDDAIAEPSLILARHDLAHREHQRLHQHHRLHKRQDATDSDATDSDATTEGEIVTEVVATISVIQQIDVDANGNTFSMILVPASTEDSSPALTDSSPTTTIASIPIPSVINIASTAASTVVDTSSNSAAQSTLSLSTTSSASAPIATPSTISSFSSLSVSSNSTTLISSSSSLSSHAFSNSTHSSSSSSLSSISSSRSSSSSLTYIKTSSSSSSIDFTSKSTSSYYSPITSSLLATSTDAGVFGIAGGTAVATDAASTSPAATEHDSGSDSTPNTPTPVIIGSVVSSVAGAAVIILAILFIWRWRKRSRTMLSLGSGGPLGGPDAIDEGPSQPSGGMTERRSLAYAVPAALASLTGYKRSSHKTDRTTVSSTAGSERGFYRVSGRKLPSVLQSGGDGYGGGTDDRINNTLSGTSFYRDSQGFYGGPGSPSFPPLGISTQRDSGVPVMRPSPARTPVTEHGPFFSEPPPLIPPARRPDGLGRSHPSQDGSHASKFTEEV